MFWLMIPLMVIILFMIHVPIELIALITILLGSIEVYYTFVYLPNLRNLHKWI
jgi:hypothetical protein